MHCLTDSYGTEADVKKLLASPQLTEMEQMKDIAVLLYLAKSLHKNYNQKAAAGIIPSASSNINLRGMQDHTGMLLKLPGWSSFLLF